MIGTAARENNLVHFTKIILSNWKPKLLPSGSNILGMSRYFSAMSKARFRFSNGLSCKIFYCMDNRVKYLIEESREIFTLESLE